ncbi:MAG TPA: peptidoglycan bridge formation glycyltransferase FemA/FemB family protein [Spirochaetales bacterium]|nr:peptidoglycan bridge formation glycyltransferase FemA/FemB family protein [Spirochaetales bacterium]HRY56124.1 peptidoglycan bridge formation glycyltransferase FemA/FemB family protein [Spirochaetia bacterium]
MRPEAVPSSLYRHPAWLAWKEGQGWRQLEAGLGFRLLLRDLGGLDSMAYGVAPRALLGKPGEGGRALEELSLRASAALPADCAFLRWDLMTEAWTDGEGGRLEPRLQELRMNASTRHRPFRKGAGEHTCVDTMLVALGGGEAAILARLDEGTRYSIRLAARRGTEVERLGEAGLRGFQALHEETARRQGFAPRRPQAFERLFACARGLGLELELYLARSEGEAAAAAIFARNGGSAWYLFAASSAAHRGAAGPSAILYRALVDCAAAGDREMDLLGVAPPGSASHPLSALSRFKSGFGGRRAARAGTWDYIIEPEAYARYAQAEGLGRLGA